MKKILFLLATIAAIAWFFKAPPPTSTPPLANPQNAAQPPVQNSVKRLTSKPYKAGKITYRAEYEITGRLLSKKEYGDIHQSAVPLDFVIVWGKAIKPDIYKNLNVTQNKRFGNYREENGSRWVEFNSSMSRNDTGHGACEVMYVEHIIIYN